MNKPLKLYAIYDRVAEEFGPPFVSKNDGTAFRQFQEVINKEGLELEQYWLFNIADYYNDTAKIIGEKKRVDSFSMATEVKEDE